MAQTTNIGLYKLGAQSKLKDFPSLFNDDLDIIDSSLGYGFGKDSNPTVKASIDAANSNMGNIAKRYSNSKYCQTNEGTLTVATVPAGTYLITVHGKTQSSQKIIWAYVDNNSNVYDDGYGKFITPINNASDVLSYSFSFVKTFSESTSLVVTYSSNWYKMSAIAVRVQV